MQFCWHKYYLGTLEAADIHIWNCSIFRNRDSLVGVNWPSELGGGLLISPFLPSSAYHEDIISIYRVNAAPSPPDSEFPSPFRVITASSSDGLIDQTPPMPIKELPRTHCWRWQGPPLGPLVIYSQILRFEQGFWARILVTWTYL